jgi:uncharacterized protein involved in exopolysaccharide biosynthesis
MREEIDEFARSGGASFPEQVWARRRFLALTCAIAAVLSALIAFLLPLKYTAVSRIVIEPPAAMDPRASVAVSPVYLESLRSYETFASSDELFSRAARQFGLRRGSEAMDKVKRSVLKVGMLRNTKILEIRVDWSDPQVAHRLALYLAEETVKLSQSVSRGSEQELVAEAEKQLEEARGRVNKSAQALAGAAARGSIDQLKARIQSDEELRAALRRRAIAEEAEQIGEPTPQLVNYRKQIESLDREITGSAKLLAELTALDAELKAGNAQAQAALKSATERFDDARRVSSYRGERLRLLDPGVVPERPSFPNVPLIIGVGLLSGLVLGLLVITLELGYAARSAPRVPPEFARSR